MLRIHARSSSWHRQCICLGSALKPEVTGINSPFILQHVSRLADECVLRGVSYARKHTKNVAEGKLGLAAWQECNEAVGIQALTPRTQSTQTSGFTSSSYFSPSSRSGINCSSIGVLRLCEGSRGARVPLNSCSTLCSSADGMGSATDQQNTTINGATRREQAVRKEELSVECAACVGDD